MGRSKNILTVSYQQIIHLSFTQFIVHRSSLIIHRLTNLL